MPYLLFDYVSEGGRNEIEVWTKALQPAERGKLNAKLDMLELNGSALRPHVLSGTDEPGVSKLRVQGGVKLRPLLCEGPAAPDGEFTLLAGAKEVQHKLSPAGVLAIAKRRKEIVTGNLERRRKHVRA